MHGLRFLTLGLLPRGIIAEYGIAEFPYGLAIVGVANKTIRLSILVGDLNTTTSPLHLPVNGTSNLAYSMVTPTVAKIQLNTSFPYTGARFFGYSSEQFYGIWEYPWNGRLDNHNITYDLKGIGNNVGINWCSARAPFFISSAGYGVYTDTLSMGSYSFSKTGEAQFVFNSSSLVYYVILPNNAGDFKSIIEQYTELSARAEMPPTSGLGPTFWSDDFEEDFHGKVSNAQENYGDVVDHLYYNQIRATSMFADRPYGTGNRSFGNFDFDPRYYPSPREFIANLTAWGFDFQVWIANRAFLFTELFNTSSSNSWLFPGVDPVQYLGPALNLSIPAARAYFKNRLEVFPEFGVKGYKIDRGEEEEMPVYEQNTQMGLFLQLAWETMQEKFGASKFFNFARSVVDRSRARTAVWNGDSHANFTGLAYSVASGIRAGLLSFPIWGSDTGGYVRDGSGDPLTPSEEVWARWMWFSAFSPVYELMLGTGHTPWYSPYTSKTVDVLKQTANLHHDLLPYIKTFAYTASKTGVPIMRALFLETPEDTNPVVWHSADQYFFGSEFLVAPIVTAGGKRTVYFPKKPYPLTRYLDYWDKKTAYDAGQTANVSAGLDSIPVYVSDNAIVVRGDTYQGNNKWTKDWKPSITVEVYPSFSGEREITYWFGEGTEGKEVKISCSGDPEERSFWVWVGDTGLEGEVVIYVKGGTERRKLEKGGPTYVQLQKVSSLFS